VSRSGSVCDKSGFEGSGQGRVKRLLFIGVFSLVSTCGVSARQRTTTSDSNRAPLPVSVEDAIAMTKVSDRGYQTTRGSGEGFARFSKDGRRFVIVVERGNLEENTNEYSLLLWSTEAFGQRAVPPEVLLVMSSSSNRPAIQEVRWLSDNETVMFLGEHPGELQQLYALNIRTKTLRRITNHPTNLIAYSATPEGDSWVFVAERLSKNKGGEQVEKNGLAIGDRVLLDLVPKTDGVLDPSEGGELYVQLRGGRPEPAFPQGTIDRLGSKASISPDGRFLLLSTRVLDIPEIWKEYTDNRVRTEANLVRKPHEPSWLERFELIDTSTRKGKILLDAPLKGIDGPVSLWMPDSRSVLLSGVFLPLDEVSAVEREKRTSASYSVEVQVPSGATREITNQDRKLLEWDPRCRCVVLAANNSGAGDAIGTKVYFRKEGEEWREVKTLSEDGRGQTGPAIVVQEDMTTPPRIFAVDPRIKQEQLLLDLNPQFRSLHFAREEEFYWQGKQGQDFRGGLYYPVDYVPGRRYPLVIQTHAFNPRKFWIDGPWTTAFAAQPLAGKNMFVLQADESYENQNSEAEVDREVDRLETAVDALDKRGLIERDRVGVLGFSRTCLFVKYALTHSNYRFAAASVTDGIDGGYFQYLLTSGISAFSAIGEGLNGGMPWGEGRESWWRRSPGFNLEKVDTPLMITALSRASLMGEWEWFAGLRRLGKPVDCILIEAEEHVLKRPWDRRISQQGTVDWFTFWLKDEEDSDPAKAEQYARWRRLRKSRDNNL
jgi:dipeptidyl aminopeptidase/acylaminoacyl peptidase